MSDFAPDRLLEQQQHRPWPLPGRGWILRQEWHDLLFAHWALPPERLRPLVPPELPLDLFDGRAWVGVVPFLVRDSRARALPAVPGATDFLELNVRTYVNLAGRAGVYFFSLDAQSALAVLGARAFYRLPYHEAAMHRSHEEGWTEYRSNRASGGAELVVRYRSTGDVCPAEPGSLDHFLVERYCLFTTGRRGRPWHTDIHHPPWPLQPAEAVFTENTMAETNGIILPDDAPVLHYAAFQPVLIWPPARVR